MITRELRPSQIINDYHVVSWPLLPPAGLVKPACGRRQGVDRLGQHSKPISMKLAASESGGAARAWLLTPRASRGKYGKHLPYQPKTALKDPRS